jgi:hypothetical protein
VEMGKAIAVVGCCPLLSQGDNVQAQASRSIDLINPPSCAQRVLLTVILWRIPIIKTGEAEVAVYKNSLVSMKGNNETGNSTSYEELLT